MKNAATKDPTERDSRFCVGLGIRVEKQFPSSEQSYPMREHASRAALLAKKQYPFPLIAPVGMYQQAGRTEDLRVASKALTGAGSGPGSDKDCR
jgi:hypothetical protein